MSEAATLPVPARSVPTLFAGERVTEAAVDPQFVARRSTRVFASTPVPPEAVRSVLEAARWAPSSANGQPWLFVVGSTPEARARLGQGLVDRNAQWAAGAPVLIYLFTRTSFEDGPFAGHPNAHAEFDAGAAWMSLALQAHRLGLSAHAMGGVHRDRLAEIAGVDPTVYRPIVAIALGYPSPSEDVPPALRESERPSPRRPLEAIYRSLDDAPGPRPTTAL